MSKKVGLRATAVGAMLAMLLGLTATAIAAGSAAPKLLAPNHRQTAPGRIRLVVEVPLKPVRGGVFITIATKRQLNKFGHLNFCRGRCDFVAAKHWTGNKYSYVAPFNFPGYWSVTPGKYYWQADYFTAQANYYGAIGWFVVK